jgi:cation diffusion facilitator CzcD-associated flavoprotein CzcO
MPAKLQPEAQVAAADERDGHVFDTVIVGAGLTGLGTAIRLRHAGVENIVILERAGAVGGTWRDTSYPGAACDIPAPLYMFSFVTSPAWSHVYPRAAEVRAHIWQMVDDHGLRPLIRFGFEVNALEFDEDCGTWAVTSASGTCLWARTVVLARGPLSDASLPGIDGIDDYRGHIMHSARWDSDYDFAGKNVAVIGTGASAVQIVPRLIESAESVTVFQRTAAWVLPRADLAIPSSVGRMLAGVPAIRRLLRTLLYWHHEFNALGLVWDSPMTRLLARMGRSHLRRSVQDPELRRRLTPSFTPGCKRILISSDYYRAFSRDNCRLVDSPITRVTPAGIRTGDNVEHRFDAIIFATGYDVHHTGPPFPVTGLRGRRLVTDWQLGAHAYKGINTHGYPNLFFMTGPNSGPSHHSLLVYVEAQIDYAVRAITAILTADLRYLDVHRHVEDAYNADIQRRLRNTTWMTGCQSYFLTADGRNPSMYPGFATQFRNQMRDFRLSDYHVAAQPAASAAREAPIGQSAC